MDTRFWDIQLILDGTYSEAQRKSVIVNSRAICNHVERDLYPLNFRSQFSRLVIECSKNSVGNEFVKITDPKMATVFVQLDIDGFEKSTDSKFQAFKALILEGIKAASKYANFPTSEINNSLEHFMQSGYQNKWVYLDKAWKRKNIRCKIICNHQIDVFELTQQIFLNDVLQHEKVLVRTMPREFLYHQYLGKLALKDGSQIVYSKGKSEISSYDIDLGVIDSDEQLAEYDVSTLTY